MIKIFSSSFINNIVSALEEKCPVNSNSSITRKELCSLISIPQEDDFIISYIFKKNLIENFEMTVGVYGGIKRKGTIVSKNINQDFINKVSIALDKLVPYGLQQKGISRTLIAKEVGVSGSKYENRITEILKMEPFVNIYFSKKGILGGIFRKDQSPRLLC